MLGVVSVYTYCITQASLSKQQTGRITNPRWPKKHRPTDCNSSRTWIQVLKVNKPTSIQCLCLQCQTLKAQARRRDDYTFCFINVSGRSNRRTRLSTVGDRAFPVAAAPLWNIARHCCPISPSSAVVLNQLSSLSDSICTVLICVILDTIIAITFNSLTVHLNSHFCWHWQWPHSAPQRRPWRAWHCNVLSISSPPSVPSFPVSDY